MLTKLLKRLIGNKGGLSDLVGAVVEPVGEAAMEDLENRISDLSGRLLKAGATISKQTDRIDELKAAAGGSWVKVLQDMVANGIITKEELYSRLSAEDIEILENN